MPTIPEADWSGDHDAYMTERQWEDQHPNLLAMLTCEQWVSSDADLARAIRLLADVALNRWADARRADRERANSLARQDAQDEADEWFRRFAAANGDEWTGEPEPTDLPVSVRTYTDVEGLPDA